MTDQGSERSTEDRAERVVIRDRRKIDPTGAPAGRHSTPDDPETAEAIQDAERAEPQAEAHDDSRESGEAGGVAEGGPDSEESTEEIVRESAGLDIAAEETGEPRATGEPGPSGEPGATEEPAAAEESAPAVEAGEPAEAQDGGDSRGPLGAELEALRAELDERTRDLQRVTAEYANYRKRVDRDRGLVAEQATGAVLSALLPVLDDLDRAREHGDLVGPFGAVAEQLTGALAKFGLSPFGEKGDPFDPNRHEAVAHLTSAEVSEPTCVEVMRRGYLLGDRLLRPALVAVADPES